MGWARLGYFGLVCFGLGWVRLVWVVLVVVIISGGGNFYLWLWCCCLLVVVMLVVLIRISVGGYDC